jgi:drug/metabolite transporter (DMT)-like permease
MIRPPTDNPRAILAMIYSMAAFVAGDALIKTASRDLPLGEMLAIRGAAGVALMLAFIHASGAVHSVLHLLTRANIARSFSDVGATHFFFAGLFMMPFADAAAIGQFAPLAVTAAAALFFAEPVGWRRWLATVVGFIGVMIIIRPGTTAFNWGAVFIIASIACIVTRDLLTRVISLDLPVSVITLSTLVAVGLSGLVRGLFETWVWPAPGALVLVVCAAITNCIGYFGVVAAMRYGDISTVGPFRYTAIPFAVLLGWLVFGEVPDMVAFVGMAIVIAAGLYTLHRERVRRLEAAAREGKP